MNESLRDVSRKRLGRISYDCFNLKEEGMRARCSEGKHLGSAKDGTLSLEAVLRGVTSGVCKDCVDFNS